MPRICYAAKRFSAAAMEMIDQSNAIIEEYRQQGFDLTLRQLYYQHVSRDLLANRQQEYKRLGSIINDARLAGLIDWEAIVDRTRNLRSLAHWDDPTDIVGACAQQFRVDKWSNQPIRPEVWIEKDALVGVIEGICRQLDVPHFSCRGYTSQSEMWSAAQRFLGHRREGQRIIVIHLGDHDPSGIDMSRDIEDRIRMFMQDEEDRFEFIRIALNMDQIERYRPPPNPAKLSDSRSTAYIETHGDESWELDALSPRVLASLIEARVEEVRNQEQWDRDVARERRGREQIQDVVDRWDDICFK